MYLEIAVFILSLWFVFKGAILSTVFAGKLADKFHISNYIFGFMLVAVISALPELIISMNSALEGFPGFGLGVLFGSNIADMTIVFTGLCFLSGRGIKIDKAFINNAYFYIAALCMPIAFGLNGYFSRLEGLVLILGGVMFYWKTMKGGAGTKVKVQKVSGAAKTTTWILFWLVGLGMLLAGAHFSLKSAVSIAQFIGVNEILIGMMIIGLGTTLPEFVFSFKSIGLKKDSLAIGDILGTVLIDATIIVGFLALLDPFYFPPKIVFITGLFMVFSSILLFYFMKSGKIISRFESFLLFVFWLAFLTIEIWAANIN